MKKKVRYSSLILILITALNNSTMPNVYAKSLDRTLIYCSEGSPIGFDPNQSLGVLDSTANAATVHDRLLNYERGGIKLEPSLAERWKLSKDNLVYTFYLRRGVKFHTTRWFTPTREFNADDVLFTFERLRNPNMPFRRAYPAEFPGWLHTGLGKIISKIEALDAYTVRFTLHKAHAPFLSNLAMPFLSILSAEYAKQLLETGKPSKINWEPVGTGPFILQKYVKDAAIYFDGNPEYWKPDDVRLSHLIFSITPDAAARVQKLKANECQIIAAPRPADIAALKDEANLQILSQAGFNMSYLAYNVTREPLDDVRVRCALDMAIDKKAIIDTVYTGHAQLAIAPMPPLQWAYDETLQDAPHDLKQAKELLAQANYPNGFSLSLWASSQPGVNFRLMAEMIQSDWAKIGVKAKIVTHEWGEYLKRAMNGEHDAMLISLTSNISDPDNWLSILRSEGTRGGYNFSKWRNQTFDSLMQRAVQVTDVAERTQLYTQAQRIFKHEQPFTPIAYPIIYQPLNKNVTNFKINPFGPTRFAGVGLK